MTDRVPGANVAPQFDCDPDGFRSVAWRPNGLMWVDPDDPDRRWIAADEALDLRRWA